LHVNDRWLTPKRSVSEVGCFYFIIIIENEWSEFENKYNNY
jgi:hypothetical protein